MPEEFQWEAETGMPLVEGTQRPLACAHMTDDSDGSLITETMVFPNFIFFWQPLGETRLGRSIVVPPNYAAGFIAELPDLIEHVNQCECPKHAGRSMDFVSCA
jgi:hypothetical protein